MAIKEVVLLLSIIMLPLVTEALRLVGPGDSIEIGEGSDEMCLKEGLKEDVAAIMRRLEDLAAKVESCGRGQNGWVSDGISSYRMLSRRYKTMADARQQCQNLGADLPIISSAKENNFIADLLAKEGKSWAWVGLQRNIVDLEFYWVNGSKLGESYDASNDEEPNSGGEVEGKFHAWSDREPNKGGVEGEFHAWNDREPNNNGGVEYCAYIMGQVSHKGKWNDCPCKFGADLVSPYVLCQKAI